MNTQNQPELLPLHIMAARMKVTHAWLRHAADNGDVPCLRAGAKLLFAPAPTIAAAEKLAHSPSPREASNA